MASRRRSKRSSTISSTKATACLQQYAINPPVFTLPSPKKDPPSLLTESTQVPSQSTTLSAVESASTESSTAVLNPQLLSEPSCTAKTVPAISPPGPEVKAILSEASANPTSSEAPAAARGAAIKLQICIIENCKNKARMRNLCQKHGGGRRCVAENCMKSANYKKYCMQHAEFVRCDAESCTRRAKNLGKCLKHYPLERKRNLQGLLSQDCSVQDCQGRVLREGKCKYHFQLCQQPECTQWGDFSRYCLDHAKGNRKVPTCPRDGCKDPIFMFCLCKTHYTQCGHKGCNRTEHERGFCLEHTPQVTKHPIVSKTPDKSIGSKC